MPKHRECIAMKHNKNQQLGYNSQRYYLLCNLFYNFLIKG